MSSTRGRAQIYAGLIGGIMGWLARTIWSLSRGQRGGTGSDRYQALMRALTEAQGEARRWADEVAALRRRLGEQEQQLRQLGQQLAERDARLADKDAKLAQLQDALNKVERRLAQQATTLAEQPPDNLEEIAGVGPALAKMLAEMGVTTFQQIAGWSDADIERVESRLKSFRGRIRRDRWIESAAALHKAKQRS